MLVDELQKSDRYNKAELILADPRHALRLKLSQADRATEEQPALLSTEAGFTQMAAEIRDSLAQYYPAGEALKAEQDAFDRELLRAQQAIRTGSSLKTIINNRADSSGPNLYTPERMMLWYATLSHLEHYKPAEGAPENPGINMLFEELRKSRGADYLFDKFCRQITSILSATGIDKKDCIIRWGRPNTHFWHSKKDPANGQKQDIINFDLKKSLLLGDMVQQTMVHELGHLLYDTQYPPTIIEKQDAVMALQQKHKQEPLSDDEQKALVRAHFEAKLYHGIWNAAADNAVDEGSHRLSSGKTPRYGYQLLPAMLTTFVTFLGQGRSIQEYQKEGPPSQEKLDELAGNPKVVLSNLSATLVQVVSLMHGQMSDPQERAALVADLPKIGVQYCTALLKNRLHAKMTGEECFWDLYEKCKRIAELTPDPQLMSVTREWCAARDSMQEQRNLIHEEIFAQYAAPAIEKLMDQQKSLQDMIDALAELKKDQQQQQDQCQGEGEQVSINVPGDGGGQGSIPVFMPKPPGSKAPDRPEPEPEDPKTIAEHEASSHDGKHDRDLEAPVKPVPGSKPSIGGLGGIGKLSPGGGGAGKATDAFVELDLGDGRTLEELRDTPQWGDAVDEMCHRFKAALALQETRVLALGDTHKLLPGRKPFRELNKSRLSKLDIHPLTNIKQLNVMRTTEPVGVISPIINEIIAIDTSGSMGWEKGSDAERAIKAAAIRVLAIEQLNIERIKKQQKPIGVYVMLWGNSTPTFLGKPYDKTQTQEIMQKLDDLLAKVFNDPVPPPGVGGGTELQGVLKETLAEIAYHRPAGLQGYRETDQCGINHLVFLTDGGIFDTAPPFNTILEQNPSLMVSALLTGGQDTALERALNEAGDVKDYQKPALSFMPHDNGILHAMAELADKNMEKLGLAVKSWECPRVFQERQVQSAAESTMVGLFGETYDRHQRMLAAQAAQRTEQITKD